MHQQYMDPILIRIEYGSNNIASIKLINNLLIIDKHRMDPIYYNILMDP